MHISNGSGRRHDGRRDADDRGGNGGRGGSQFNRGTVHHRRGGSSLSARGGNGHQGREGGSSHQFGHRDYDRLNYETFGGISEPWQPSEAQVHEFEAFKRRQKNSGGDQVSTSQGAPGGVPSGQVPSSRPNLDPALRASSGGGGMQPQGHQVPQGNYPEQSPFPAELPPIIRSPVWSTLAPFTEAHRQAVKNGQRLYPWLAPAPMGLSEDPNTSWMTSNELETILKYQLMQMQIANQALTRPKTLSLHHPQPSGGMPSEAPAVAITVEAAHRTTGMPSTAGTPAGILLVPPPPASATLPGTSGPPSGAGPLPPTQTTSSESSPSSGAFGRSRYSSVSGPREALGPAAQYRRTDSPGDAGGASKPTYAKCLCGMLRFCRTQAQCPATDRQCLTRSGEIETLRYIRAAIEEGFTALSENNLAMAMEILAPYEFDPEMPPNPDGSPGGHYAIRLGALAATDKGLKFAADTLQRLTMPFPDEKIPDMEHAVPPLTDPSIPRFLTPPLVVVFSLLENFEQVAFLCQSTVCDLFYQCYLQPLWYIIRSRADRPLCGPASAAGVLERRARRQLELNEFVDMPQNQHHPGHPHVVRLWSLVLVNVARAVEVLGSSSDRSALLSFLVAYMKAFLTGYLNYLRTYEPTTTQLVSKWLVPLDHAESLLGSPPFYLLNLTVLLALQMCPTAPDPNITAERVLAAMAMVVQDRTKSVKDHIHRLPDRAIIITMISLITRVALRQSLRIRGILTPAIHDPSLAPPVVNLEVPLTGKVEALLAGANCLFGTIALAMTDPEVESILKKVPPSCGCSAEGVLMALHQHFPPTPVGAASGTMPPTPAPVES